MTITTRWLYSVDGQAKYYQDWANQREWWRLACPAPFAKIFLFSRTPNQIYISCHPVPHRGAYRDRHGRWARDAVDAAASGARIARWTNDAFADGEVVWS